MLMAINASNSNFVNINNLPKSQIALDPDLLVLQTQNGTQAITFENFNVVKTDENGNATVTGDLSGGYADLKSAYVGEISVDQVYSNNLLGTTNSMAYQNRIQTTNGIITSSDYTIGSPEYVSLYNLYQTLSANSSSYYKKVFESVTTATVNNGAQYSQIMSVSPTPLNYQGIKVGSLIGADINGASFFCLTPVPNGVYLTQSPAALSGLSYNSLTDTLTFVITLGVANTTGQPNYVKCRLVYFYE